MDVLRPLFDWLVDHTYVVVFVGTLIDATGLPFPGRLLLVAAGAAAGAGHASILVVIVLGAAGAMLVDQLWYLAVARRSTRLIDLYCRLSGFCGEDDGQYVERYGGATIVLGRFFTSIRVVAWPFAARHGLGYTRFVLLDAVGALLWSALWVLLGWVVGAHWESAAKSVGAWVSVLGALVIAALAAPLAMRLWRRRSRTGAVSG
jgi:undecaprenyl-diphosphatase